MAMEIQPNKYVALTNQLNKDMLLKGLMSLGNQNKPNKERQMSKGKKGRLKKLQENQEDIISKLYDEILFVNPDKEGHMLKGKKGRLKELQDQEYMISKLPDENLSVKQNRERQMLEGKKERLKEVQEDQDDMISKLPDMISKLPDEIFSVKSNKEKQMLKGKKLWLEGVVQKDMISKLPDEILVSIMCFLDMEKAARMSVVSRRWQKIWKSTIQITPKLTFDIDGMWSMKPGTRDSIKKRINELNAVLKLHEAPTLDEFLLYGSKLCTKEDSHHINTWIDFAAKKQVQKLTLSLPYDYDPPTFLADNFHCLRDLCIEGSHVTENLIQRLFSNSPFVERFSLKYADKLHMLKIDSAPNLKYLRIEDSKYLRRLKISSSVQNLNTLEIRDRVDLESVNISAPNLSHLILGIDRVTKLESCTTLLAQIKRLTLHIEAFTDTISAKIAQLPKLSKVEHLELLTTFGWQMPIHCLPDILKAAPVLNTFSFQDYKPKRHTASFNGLEWLDKHIPKKVEVNHYHSCQRLRVVKLDMFAGCQYEVEFLLHLLEYALSVEKIIIQIIPSGVWRRKSGLYGVKGAKRKYEEVCLGCAQLLETKILHMHPSANVILKICHPSTKF